MMGTLIALAVIFSQLSLLAFGGGNTVLPEMQRQVVHVHQWMSAQEFSALFALAQAAPGPNMMIVTMIGWHVGGWGGLLVTTVAKFGPSSLVTLMAFHAWERYKDHPWRGVVQRALIPVTVGIVAASALLIAESSNHSGVAWLITGAVALAAHRAITHPLWLLAAGAMVGLTGIGQ